MRKAQPGREASGDKGQWGRPQPGPARRRALLPAPHSRPPARHGSPHLSLSLQGALFGASLSLGLPSVCLSFLPWLFLFCFLRGVLPTPHAPPFCPRVSLCPCALVLQAFLPSPHSLSVLFLINFNSRPCTSQEGQFSPLAPCFLSCYRQWLLPCSAPLSSARVGDLPNKGRICKGEPTLRVSCLNQTDRAVICPLCSLPRFLLSNLR